MTRDISIHAPLAGCDTDFYYGRLNAVEIFQSTHPLRGATEFNALSARIDALFQSTHPLRGATPGFADIGL